MTSKQDRSPWGELLIAAPVVAIAVGIVLVAIIALIRGFIASIFENGLIATTLGATGLLWITTSVVYWYFRSQLTRP